MYKLKHERSRYLDINSFAKTLVLGAYLMKGIMIDECDDNAENGHTCAKIHQGHARKWFIFKLQDFHCKSRSNKHDKSNNIHD